MFFRYGSYTHAANEVSLTITQRPIFNARGFRQATRKTWTIDGELQANSPAELTAAIRNIELAYSVNGLDVGFFDNNGSITGHAILSSETVGGTRVVGFDWPVGDGTEYVTHRTYRIVIEADFRTPADDTLVSFRETVRTIGTGGPRVIHLETLRGPPVKQITGERTVVRAVQSGEAVGYLGYPVVPPPAWPDAELASQREITRTGPQATGGMFTDYRVSWNYVFESAGPLVGLPRSL